eukprot:m.178061 g.178061  ORF g.178061 m.178061 type:complete len:145 (-) comp18385_c0_seq5:7446-7880(-)
MGECKESQVNRALEGRIARITGTPVDIQEYFQVLSYDEGQYYKVHHDYIDGHATMPCGPRILTAFIYFSDVEEGGHTHFPMLGIKVPPKQGRMLLWPHVFGANLTKDHRTEHEAMPVIKGNKISANAWLHLYDFRTPNNLGCTG